MRTVLPEELTHWTLLQVRAAILGFATSLSNGLALTRGAAPDSTEPAEPSTAPTGAAPVRP